jgi:hypothetical protein
MRGILSKQQDGTYAQFGRPTGLAVANERNLLVGDGTFGTIYTLRTMFELNKRRDEARRRENPRGRTRFQQLLIGQVICGRQSAFYSDEPRSEPNSCSCLR